LKGSREELMVTWTRVVAVRNELCLGGPSQEDLLMCWMQGFGFVNWGMAEPFTLLGRPGKGNVAA